MANHYKRNMELLIKNNPVMQLTNTVFSRIADKDANVAEKDGILYFKYEGKYYRLHSEDKQREAELLTKDLQPGKDHLIVLFGMANVVLLRKLLTETSPGTRIAVFEPNVYVFQYIVSHQNLTDIFSSNKVGIIAGDELNINRQVSLYMEQRWDNLAKNLVVISLPNYYLYEEFRTKNFHNLTSKIGSMLKNLGTDLEDMLDGLTNHYSNVDACLTSNGISEIRDRYKGYPAIVVASGPSLDKNIGILKEVQGKALIIACDASYQACLENGVKPDMIASIERYYPTYQYFYEGKTFDKDLVLVGPSLLWPDIYKTFPGKKILMAKSNRGVEQWWSDHFEKIEFVNQGMSCANVAYAVAAQAGCSPIILIGQDLAYTGEKIHSDQAHTKFEGENKTQIQQGINDIWVEDVFGEKVRTSVYYELFRHYFEEQQLVNPRLVIDATEGGAKIRGTKIMTLRETIDQYCSMEIPFRLVDFLQEMPYEKDKAIAKYQEIVESAERMLSELKTLQKMVIEHYERILKYKDMDFLTAREEVLYDAVMEMEYANPIITYVIEEKDDLVSYYQQIIKQTIIAVKELGNELDAAKVRRNWELQMNLMYMMDITTAATGKRFEEMTAFMKEMIRMAEEGGEEV